jgi:hypothetical protein
VLLFAKNQQGHLFLNELSMQGMEEMTKAMAHAGIELSVTKHPERIFSPHQCAMALTCTAPAAGGDNNNSVENYAYMVDLPTAEHVCVSFKLVYPLRAQIHPCGMAPAMVNE